MKSAEHPRASHRWFGCRHCGHRLRFDAPRCGDCFNPTPMHNRRAFWVALCAALAVCALASVLRELT